MDSIKLSFSSVTIFKRTSGYKDPYADSLYNVHMSSSTKLQLHYPEEDNSSLFVLEFPNFENPVFVAIL